ncbi:hypothetical protein Acsp01_34940 [Actinoplanes sp. NBRC 101535]|nr:hypothetical protein Acsp01_34940 [Actinoplanes sp. NBRC 101535]
MTTVIVWDIMSTSPERGIQADPPNDVDDFPATRERQGSPCYAHMNFAPRLTSGRCRPKQYL